MRLQESQLLRTRRTSGKSPLNAAIDSVGGACRLITDPKDVLPSERVISVNLAGLSLAVSKTVGPREAVELRRVFEQALNASTQLDSVTEALSVRDKTLSKICDVMASYSQQQEMKAEFIETLGAGTKYAVVHHEEIVINRGFTGQAMQAGLAHLERGTSNNIRVLDGELFVFRYHPYSLLVEAAQPIPEALKHLMQIYVQQLGHRERTEEAQNTEKKVDQMEWLANHDPLTGLANRRLLTQFAESLVKQEPSAWERHANLHLDLDGFKLVNDTYGHEVGDELLKHVADRIKDECMVDDLIARTGGDEFVVLRPRVSHAEEVEALAARLISSIGLPTILSGKRCHIGVSIGISWWCANTDGTGKSVAEWMREADEAMYEIKRNGKSAYRVA